MLTLGGVAVKLSIDLHFLPFILIFVVIAQGILLLHLEKKSIIEF